MAKNVGDVLVLFRAIRPTPCWQPRKPTLLCCASDRFGVTPANPRSFIEAISRQFRTRRAGGTRLSTARATLNGANAMESL